MKTRLLTIVTLMRAIKRTTRFGLLGDGFVALFMVVLLILGTALTCSAQVQQAWVAHYNNGITNGTNQALKMALDSNGNIVVVGVSQNTNNQLGYVTIKYAPNGNPLWATRYDSANSPTATPAAMALDSSNNVLITGSALTTKYDPNGNLLWTASYNGNAISLDPIGNAFVTGVGLSFSTVKLSSTGSNLWQATFSDLEGPAESQIVLVDNAGNAYVAGSATYSSQQPAYEQFLVIKYDQNGIQLWDETFGSDGPNGSVIIGGGALAANGTCSFIVNFNDTGAPYVLEYGSNGVQDWNCFLNQGGINPRFTLAIDNKSQPIAVGEAAYGFNGNVEYYFATMQLNPNGEPVWTNFYPEPPIGSSAAQSIAIDSLNNDYVTGYSPGATSGNDIVTIKYAPSGNQLWLQRYNGLGNGNDAGNAIAVDKSGNVYVTGYETLLGGGTGIVTIKYVPISIQRQPNGSVLIETQGSPGESFDIQASSDLLNWLALGTILADTNGIMQFDDTNAPNFPARFYYTNPR